MEFHDILHGEIIFPDGNSLTELLRDLINSPEVNRLRNMRQMNFDVPLIQELGRSRRLPHSIGVAHIAMVLGRRAGLSEADQKVFLAAAILHDAAIPPYGHLVESELKNVNPEFKHEQRVKDLIKGKAALENSFQEIVPGRSLQLQEIFSRHGVSDDRVIELICPPSGRQSPISAEIDIDNIDNVHRMAAMLGWDDAKSNLNNIIDGLSLNGLGAMSFSEASIPSLEKWHSFRERIYTLIIANRECIPYNALQADLVRLAVKDQLIGPNDWYQIEPLFEDLLRKHPSTSKLATQLISGTDYQLIDYVWIKGFTSIRKTSNAEIERFLIEQLTPSSGYGYFVWNEKGLVSRRVNVDIKEQGQVSLGKDSTSCMIALVKHTHGKPKRSKQIELQHRAAVISAFSDFFGTHKFWIDYPETYTGEFWQSKNGNLEIGYY
ncbi:HD domain-containing protein [uncultured Variovorax sp.]|uniref:HD domain-containing protein n=1 Tax=uncultured Variovorax sp. TaxID=114708 RepID=UPI0025E507DA|nr:HD domain-containing protein [uncultured Variovorax sp.]